nr:UvrD-helicase domain-containing protein [uncultured Steroidobacter sp.]
MSSSGLVLPSISDDDIAWACRVLGLPQSAFTGSDGNDPRLAVIKWLDPLDVEACPGSGKTTLLVAKLAILARHWTERRRGICVLSHTNVARREIENRLGYTPEGKRLLSYPHFVGTIHAFVNEFLALPWLRSKPFPVRIIDDEVCLQRRWGKLPWKTRAGLESNSHDKNVLRMAATDFSVGAVRWGKNGVLSTTSETYQALKGACRTSCEEGYFCHNEMFLWALELLDRAPKMREALRGRFPLLFIDEVQDTSEEQSLLLSRLFMEGANPVIRQRFGDSNQAIYQYSGQRDTVTTDPFPDTARLKTIPNSHRFGQEIADFANPLAAYPHGLIGLGPRCDEISSDTAGKHAIFLFDDQTVGHVMPCYASYLIELFSETELQAGIFTAVGAVHRPGDDDKVPRFVAHYWSAYDHELATSEPRPGTFLQYLTAGRQLTRSSGETHHMVEKIADGVLRLVGILNPLADIPARKRKHRCVREVLAGHPELDKSYVEIVSLLATGRGDAAFVDWKKWAPQVLAIAAAIAGTSEDSAAATAFLSLQQPPTGDSQPSASTQRDNVFRYPSENPKAHIRVGSIHSIKGETHTATLVLDTFFHSHHVCTLRPWLIGKKVGGGSENARNISRLKQHYVAMSRPSHLLCLAMREDCLSNGDVSTLKERGWRTARVTAGGVIWL